MTRKLNTKVTGFEERIYHWRVLGSGDDSDYIASAIIGDMQSALAAKDAEIAELRGLLVEALEQLSDGQGYDSASGAWIVDRERFVAKLIAALAEKGGDL